ncbi:MAG: aminoacyl-tRNA hydrolase [Phycisphaerales bacterium]|nr:aminoacyl-tRNA hydrolase [Phycisphaerales bacterium]
MDGSEERQQDESGVEIAPGVSVPSGVLRFKATRSSGPGGQNVNKVATRVELRVLLSDLPLTSRVLARLRRRERGRITGEGELIIANEETRSQHRNKSRCLELLREVLVGAMAEPRPRIPTRPSRGSVERRLQAKNQRSEQKRLRRRPDAG